MFWIYLSHCLYEHTDIARYQAAHNVSKSLASLSKEERLAVLSVVCSDLIKIKQPPEPQPTTPAPAVQTIQPASVLGSGTTPPSSPALSVWREKLDFLLEQQAITADPAQKFQLKKAVEEARQKIKELGG